MDLELTFLIDEWTSLGQLVGAHNVQIRGNSILHHAPAGVSTWDVPA